MFWLLVNGGKVGPFANLQALYARYREIVQEGTRILSAKVFSGKNAEHFEHVIQ